MRLVILKSAILSAVLTASGAASVSACDFGYCWGAIAAGDHGRVGYVSGVGTAPWAAERVEQSCGDTCNTVEVFHDQCGAIAESSTRVHFAGFGLTREDAVSNATAACSEQDAFCRVRVWACSLQ